MENYAKKLALEHNVTNKINRKSNPSLIIKESFRKIKKAYLVLTESALKDVPIGTGGEWLLDNFYIIEEQIEKVKNEIDFKKFKSFPGIKGEARIFVIAKEMVKITQSNVTKENAEKFILAYQSKKKLSQDEIFYIAPMLKCALIVRLGEISEKIISSQYQKFKVASLVERIIKRKPPKKQAFSKYKEIKSNGKVNSYIEYLVYLLKREGKSSSIYIDALSEEIEKAGLTLDEIIQIEHYDMALTQVEMRNIFTSLRNILRYDWGTILTNINGVEVSLSSDKWYSLSDNRTKERYRNEINRLSKKSGYSENYIANQVVEFADTNQEHIGEYLIGDKKDVFLRSLGMKARKKLKQNTKLFWYVSAIYIASIYLSIIFLGKFFIFGIIPFSEVISSLLNRIIEKIKKPQSLPSLEKVPESVNAFLVVPTLLKSKERVRAIFKNIESFYLGNNIPNLYFALLGDCSEEDTKDMDFDEEVIHEGTTLAKKLNEKYGKEIFFFLYRERMFNSSQGKWLGYERKRGMITEFVNFLKNKNTNLFKINTIKEIPKIKYIITLDADTIIARNGVEKLITIMEHPMNTPKVDKNIVRKGYGLVQPKIGISMESSTYNLFSKLYAGSGGIDAYSTAEFNIYQDLFGEGIFTGKGIFNVDLFYELLKDEIPENLVLSHDLLEGSYLRCGQTNNVTLIDGFPKSLIAYFDRLSRWTRGDFQISSWLFKKRLNPVSKYKIFDNLRRSVYDIFLVSLIFLGFESESMLIIFAPFLIDILEKYFTNKDGVKAKNYLPVVDGVRGSLMRCTVNLIILPYKAYIMADAIIRALYRMFISKRHLLDWVTAHDSELKIKGNLKEHLIKLRVNFYLRYFTRANKCCF